MYSHCGIPRQLTAVYVFAVINLTILINIALVEANVVVRNEKNESLWEAPDLPARFGEPIPEDGISGHLMYITSDACNQTSIEPPLNISDRWIAMIARGGCAFEDKVANAERKKYVAAIIHNIDSDDLIPMGQGGRLVAHIPSVFIGEHDAMRFKKFQKQLRYTLWLDRHRTFDYWPLMRDFIVIASAAFAFGLLIGLAVLIVRWIRDIRRRRRSRLSQAHLKKIPVKKFKKGDEYDMCAICLDEYEEGDKLRILPCSHAYHQKCIDPWLTKNKKFCPICKRKVIPGDDNSDSEDDTEDDTGNENTPLLGASGGNTASPPRTRGGGTFDNSGLPSAVRDNVHPLLYEDSSDDEESYTASTSNYQSSVEVHSSGHHGNPRVTTLRVTNETRSDDSGDTESADSENDFDDDVESSRMLQNGVDNHGFEVVEDYFSGENPTSGTEEVEPDEESLSAYRPLAEFEGPDDLPVVTISNVEEETRERDRIV